MFKRNMRGGRWDTSCCKEGLGRFETPQWSFEGSQKDLSVVRLELVISKTVLVMRGANK